MLATMGRYNMRQKPPDRHPTWRQKVHILDADSGRHTFYLDFGEYPDGALCEVFISAHKTGTFVRGTLESLARSVSLALQSGTSPADMARQLRGQDYPPHGQVDTGGASSVTECLSIADYIGREIQASYGPDGRRMG